MSAPVFPETPVADDNAYLAASTLFQMALTQVRADGSTGWTVSPYFCSRS